MWSALGLDRVAPLFLLFQVFVPIHGRDIGDFTPHQHDGVSAELIPSAVRIQTALRFPQQCEVRLIVDSEALRVNPAGQ